jgi:hypothetical protein
MLDLRGANQGRGTDRAGAPFGEPGAGDTRIPIDAVDYKGLHKSVKAQRALSVIITRGDSDDDSATVSALVELYDTISGGLVGRGEGTFTATVAASEEDAATGKKPNRTYSEPIVNGRARTVTADAEQAQMRALGGAVYRAVAELNRPAEARGVVISIPGAYQTRISLGTLKGLRNGARLEYLSNGQPVAYGTIISAAAGESTATVAPETAFPGVHVNMEVRNVSNPVAARAGQSEEQIEEKEFSRFEKQFGIALLVAGLGYYINQKYDIFNQVDTSGPVPVEEAKLLRLR